MGDYPHSLKLSMSGGVPCSRVAAQPQAHTEFSKNLDGTAQGLFLFISRTQFLDPGLILQCLSPAGPYQDAFSSPLLTLWSAVAVFPGDIKYP